MKAPGPVPKLRTAGVLAADLGVPIHRVLHVLRTRSHIRPTASAGRLRLYDRAALEQVKKELEAIDSTRRQEESHGE